MPRAPASGVLSVVLCDNVLIRKLNKKYLRHDRPTDVLTFSLSDAADPQWVKEVIVSVERAVQVAGRYGQTWRRELLLYIVHGLLHVAGAKDATPGARAVMRKKEEEVLAALDRRKLAL